MKRSAVWLVAFFVLYACGAGVACGTSVESDSGDGGKSKTDGGKKGSHDGGSDSGALPECSKPSDCPPDTVCSASGVCVDPTCVDGTINGTETDIDCGGSCAPCDVSKACATGADCTSGSCQDLGEGLKCQPPSCTDDVKNAVETDVDCGGGTCGKCATGKACSVRADCVTDVCTGGLCVEPRCDDTLLSGTETDVDCGGPGCPRCADTKSCKVADDCTSGVCADVGQGLQCQPATCTDGVKNGAETDVDCGGGTCGKCAIAKGCSVHADCVSDGCDYNGKCALRRSCTAHYGGDTCGPGGPGGQGPAAWESCCTTAPAGAGGVAMDKYKITSGRVRAFIDRVNGDVRSAVRDLRTAGKIPTVPGDPAHSLLDPGWDLYLPTAKDGCEQNNTCDLHSDGAGGKDIELTDHFYTETAADDFKGIYTSAYRHLGGSMWVSQVQGAQGCSISAPGTHTYWMSAATQSKYFGDLPAEFTQSDYDVKPINCTTYIILQAFCIWDGGRLETVAEWTAALGPDAYPWGPAPNVHGVDSNTYYAHRFPDATDVSEGLAATESIERANFLYSYEYPHMVDSDFVVFLSAPGRLQKGNGPFGHADLAYSMFEQTSDLTWNASPKGAISRWAQNGSWEGHGFVKGDSRNVDNTLDKYGKLSGRCVYP